LLLEGLHLLGELVDVEVSLAELELHRLVLVLRVDLSQPARVVETVPYVSLIAFV